MKALKAGDSLFLQTFRKQSIGAGSKMSMQSSSQSLKPLMRAKRTGASSAPRKGFTSNRIIRHEGGKNGVTLLTKSSTGRALAARKLKRFSQKFEEKEPQGLIRINWEAI
jgi:hypothetical protein